MTKLVSKKEEFENLASSKEPSFNVIVSLVGNSDRVSNVSSYVNSLSKRKQLTFTKQLAKRIAKVLSLLLKNLKTEYPISKSTLETEFLPANVPVERAFGLYKWAEDKYHSMGPEALAMITISKVFRASFLRFLYYFSLIKCKNSFWRSIKTL